MLLDIPTLIPLRCRHGVYFTTGNPRSAVWAKDTAELLSNTADPLPCADTQQRGHDIDNDGRGNLPCVHANQTRQRVCRVSSGPHDTIKVFCPLPRQGGAPDCRVPGEDTTDGLPCSPSLPCVWL
jgi:hypothetical protein